MHLALYYLHKRYLGSQLSKGNLTSHERFSLVLLCSQPDTIRRFPLRKDPHVNTTFLGQPYRFSPRQDITPARAVCRYRAPLTPRLHGSFINFSTTFISIRNFPPFVNINATCNFILSIWDSSALARCGLPLATLSSKVIVFYMIYSFYPYNTSIT